MRGSHQALYAIIELETRCYSLVLAHSTLASANSVAVSRSMITYKAGCEPRIQYPKAPLVNDASRVYPSYVMMS